jgi:uncharacterized membrane protein YeaQ/YmgE (transglycosylase-associated protein family)
MYLIIAIILGVICALIASSKGRNPFGWFVIGFLLGIIGLIIACVASNLEEAQQKEVQMENEQRRLREQLRQERIKNDKFRNNTQTRLDKHDDFLGMDTRKIYDIEPTPESEKLNEGYTPTERSVWEDVPEDEPLI